MGDRPLCSEGSAEIDSLRLPSKEAMDASYAGSVHSSQICVVELEDTRSNNCADQSDHVDGLQCHCHGYNDRYHTYDHCYESTLYFHYYYYRYQYWSCNYHENESCAGSRQARVAPCTASDYPCDYYNK